MRKITFIYLLSMLLGLQLLSQTIKLEPYASWLYDEPVYHVEFRESTSSFPIQFMARPGRLEFFDESGKVTHKYPFNPTQIILKSPKNSSIAIMDKQFDYKSIPPAGVLSFQVFDSHGRHEYAFAKSFFLFREEPSFQLSDPGILFETDRSNPNVSFYFKNDTLLSENLENDKVIWPQYSGSEAFLLRAKKEILFFSVNARTAPTRNDSFFVVVTNSRLEPLRMEKFKGDILSHKRVRNSDYFLIESQKGDAVETLLFNGSQLVCAFPVEKEKILVSDEYEIAIKYIDRIEMINLADGQTIRSISIEKTDNLLGVSSFNKFGIVSLLTAENMKTEDNKQYYQNIHTILLNSAGLVFEDIVKDVWTPVKPSLIKIDESTFGLHIHNAIFVYKLTRE